MPPRTDVVLGASLSTYAALRIVEILLLRCCCFSRKATVYRMLSCLEWNARDAWLTGASRIPLVRTSSELAVRRAGKAPEGTVPSPSPGRHAATRSRRGISSSSPPTADVFGTGTPLPSPQSQSFSQTYGSIFPTTLAYIVPSTRGCSPWIPDAVMITIGCGRHSVLRIFKGRWECTGQHTTCGALPATGPYLRLSRFQGGQAVKQKR
ncbi:hypothetical protein CQW23_34296 [Capsicum baccatum]|uniref:Protein TAR1 n=1 Tax=Capsicum baccatum TaxID=33114 RepID=A0A2G2UZE1_CAPBA|nr:hypothetical protein CQW23_34296 [Capsicum baccatum]